MNKITQAILARYDFLSVEHSLHTSVTCHVLTNETRHFFRGKINIPISTHPYMQPFIYTFIHLSINTSIYLHIHDSIHPSILSSIKKKNLLFLQPCIYSCICFTIIYPFFQKYIPSLINLKNILGSVVVILRLQFIPNERIFSQPYILAQNKIFNCSDHFRQLKA